MKNDYIIRVLKNSVCPYLIIAVCVCFDQCWSKEKLSEAKSSVESPRETASGGGLVCHLKFDEGRGDVVTDDSGEGNNGKINGEPTWVKGISGSALEFNGEDNWANIENDPFDVSERFSVSVWVNPLEYKKTAWEIKIIQQRLGSCSWSLFQADRDIAFAIWHSDKLNFTASAKSVLTIGEWVHIVGVFDGSKVKLYVNGEMKNSKEVTESVIESTGGVQIGWDGSWKDRQFHGKIDEVQLYNRALSDAEILTNYQKLVSKEKKKEGGEVRKEEAIKVEIPQEKKVKEDVSKPKLELTKKEHPFLFFTPYELTILKKRITSEKGKQIWDRIYAQAKSFIDPKSNNYANPEEVAVDKESESRKKYEASSSSANMLIVHQFGRRLTNWMETLGFVYQLTGEKEFARHGIKILVAFARELPVTEPIVATGFSGGRGDIMRGLAIGYDWLYPAMTEEERNLVARVNRDYVLQIINEINGNCWWKPYHNYIGVCMGSAGILSLSLLNEYPDEARKWISECTSWIKTWLDNGFDDRGAYFEGIGYANYGLGNAILFVDALLKSGGENLFLRPHLIKVPHFFAMYLLPGEKVYDAFNDAGYGGCGNFMLRLAETQKSGLARWLWDKTGGGELPFQLIWENDIVPVEPKNAGEPLSEHFTGGGLAVFRTGWEKDDLMFSIVTGHYHDAKSSTHGQSDKGHFTLYGLGYRWAIDSGYGGGWFPRNNSTEAHNCILIDEEGQAPSSGGNSTKGSIIHFEDNKEYGYVIADVTEAYNKNNAGIPGAPVVHALRHAIFVKPQEKLPAYAIILDDIQKKEETSEEIPGEIIENASGQSFVEARGGMCELNFNVLKAGEYAVWARVRAGGQELGKSDSFYAGVDKGEVVEWHMPSKAEWTWGRVARGVNQEEVIFPLKPGEHKLIFKTREHCAQIDRVMISDDPGINPEEAETGKIKNVIFIEAENGKVIPSMRKIAKGGKAKEYVEYDWLLHASEKLKFNVGDKNEVYAVVYVPMASGDFFVTSPAEISTGPLSPDVAGSGRCELNFKTDKEGEYVLWARVRAGGQDLGKSDSFYVSMDGGKWIAWHMPTKTEWTWGKVNDSEAGAGGWIFKDVSFSLKPGEHKLIFKTRESGAQIDKIMITDDPEINPGDAEEDKTKNVIFVEAEKGSVTAPMQVIKEIKKDDKQDQRMSVQVAWPSSVKIHSDIYQPMNSPNHPRLHIVSQAKNPYFACILTPLPPGMEPPSFKAEQKGNSLELQINWQKMKDEIKWIWDARSPVIFKREVKK